MMILQDRSNPVFVVKEKLMPKVIQTQARHVETMEQAVNVQAMIWDSDGWEEKQGWNPIFSFAGKIK